MKKNKRARGLWIAGIVLALALGAGLLVFFAGRGQEESGSLSESEARESSGESQPHPDESGQSTETSEPSESSESSGSSGTEDSYPFYHSDEETFPIETPFAVLRYPTRWQEAVLTSCEDGRVLFSAAVSSGPVSLFELRFGVEGGYLLGYLDTEEGALPVYIESFSFGADLLSEEEYERCCAMSEDVNVLISHLIDEYGLSMDRPSGPDGSGEESGESGGESFEESGEESYEPGLFEIETPFAVLKYPARWKEALTLTQTGEDPYALLFSCGPIRLFTLTFCEEAGYYLGSFRSNGVTVPLYITSYSFDEETLSAEDYERCCIMSEDVNVLLEQLRADYGLAMGGSPEESAPDDGVFEIETRYAVLKYPIRYAEYLRVRTTDGTPLKLSFFAQTSIGEVELFDLLFDGGDGYLLGSFTAADGRRVPLRIVSCELPEGELSPEEFDLCCAMEEEVNTILAYLQKDYRFVFGEDGSGTGSGSSEESVPFYQTDAETFTIETKYADLKYPSVWQELLSVSIKKLGTYTVSFYAKTSAGELLLFELSFDGGDGYLLGLLPYKNKSVELRITSYDFDKTGLSAEEYERCCAMSEDVNVIISKLIEEYGLDI